MSGLTIDSELTQPLMDTAEPPGEKTELLQSLPDLSSLPDVLKLLEKQEVPSLTPTKNFAAMGLCSTGAVLVLEDGSVVKYEFSPFPSQSELLRTTELRDTTQCLAVTPDGSVCVTGGRSNTLQFWSLTNLQESGSTEITDNVTTLALTNDGRLCAVGMATEHSILLFDVEKQAQMACWVGHEKTVGCLLFTPDGKYCVSGSWDNSVRVWGRDKDKEPIVLRGHTESITCLCATSDNLVVISGSSDHTLKVWNIEKSAEITTLYGHTDMVTCLVVTSDNSMCISAAADNSIRIWSIVKQIEVGLLRGHLEEVTSLALTPDGGYLVSGGRDKMIKLWSIENKLEIANFKGGSGIKCVGVMADGNSIISGSEDGTLMMWTLVKRHEKPLATHEGIVTCMDISRQGSFAVWGTTDHAMTLWNIKDRKAIVLPCTHSEPIVSVYFTPDERYFVSASNDKSVKLWSTSDCVELHTFSAHQNFITCLAVTSDSKYCLSGSQDTTIRLWDLEQKEEIRRDFRHSEGVTCLAICADNSKFVSGSSDKVVILWGLNTFMELQHFEGHEGAVTCVAISPDGQWCVSGANDKTVRLWGLANFKKRAVFKNHTKPVTCVSFTPNGLYFLSASEDGSLGVFSPSSAVMISSRRALESSELVSFLGHSGVITSLAVTKDSKYCLSAGQDRSLKIWSLDNFRMYAEYTPGLADAVQCLAVTPDQKTCLIGSRDRTVRSQSVNLCDWEQRKDEPAPYELISRINSFKENVCKDRYQARACFPSHYFNSLHISAFGNLPHHCNEYLMMDVPLIRGAFGSPLTVALDRKAIECIDVFLQYLINLTSDPLKGDSTWLTFVPFTDDLPKLLESNSSLLVAFFSVLMQSPAYPALPQFIIPIHSLPIITHLDSRLINAKEFQKSTKGEGEDLVKFLISLVRWNLTPGSESSIKFLNALAECDNKLVLTAPFNATIIQEKWNKFYPFTLGITLLYSLLLVNLTVMVTTSMDISVLIISFLSLNAFFLLYELAQMLSAGWEYLRDPWNYIDLVRGGLSIWWAVPIVMKQEELDEDFTLLVVVLCFVRGFTYFRSFKMTRIFVYMTMAVVRDMYSFLAILAYSVFGFGVFSSVMRDRHSIGLSWKTSFNLIMGNFNNDDYSSIEWIVFMSASVTNVIIMLNLLISILGEAYEKTQMSVRENDLHQQLTLLIEYESMLYWRKTEGAPCVMVTCEEVKGASAPEEWSGVILEIIGSIKTTVENRFGRMESNLNGVERRFTVLEEKLAGLAGVGEKLGRLANTEEKLAAVDSRFAGIEEKLSHLTGVGDKLTGVEGKFYEVSEKLARLEGIEDKLRDISSTLTELNNKQEPQGQPSYEYTSE